MGKRGHRLDSSRVCVGLRHGLLTLACRSCHSWVARAGLTNIKKQAHLRQDFATVVKEMGEQSRPLKRDKSVQNHDAGQAVTSGAHALLSLSEACEYLRDLPHGGEIRAFAGVGRKIS